MRALVLTLVVVCTAAAQSVPVPTITVVDENGVAVSSARVSLKAATHPAIHCETDFNGRCHFPSLAAGEYDLGVEKEGYYALTQPKVQISSGSNIEVAISHQQEVRETVNVHESPPAIDASQIASQETISGLDVIDIVYPDTTDYRNVLNFIPGVVQDQAGQPLVRVSTDAFRSIQVEPSREPAEYGKGSGGVLKLNTGIGDDHFRFWATDFIPSVQDKHGWRFDQFLPRFTFSGPMKQGKVWFYNAFDGEYDNLVFTELPVGHDNDHTLRLDNLTKIQSNITNRNIL